MTVRVSPEWLALREPADAHARDASLAAALAARLSHAVHLSRVGADAPSRADADADVPSRIYDLGCGTGSMSRWLAPRIGGPQHWIMCDHDPDLLVRAVAGVPARSCDGRPVTAEARTCDVTRLTPADLAGASAIVASALLDMFTADELDRFVDACAAPRVPVLLTITVVGRVRLTPPEPCDGAAESAFNDHQRRAIDRGRLLGPQAGHAAMAAFCRRGYEVRTRPSPWRIDAQQCDLIVEWLDGWVGAACEQRPDLASELQAYGRRRRAQAESGQLAVTVEHLDLLAMPPDRAC